METRTDWLSWIRGNQFVAYLWGMETLPLLSLILMNGAVCSLPMRNGNNYFRRRRPHWIYVCSLPMRNGNTDIARVLRPVFIRVCSLPMRNGNMTCGPIIPTMINAFVAYLWGMETSARSKDIFLSVSFVAYLWGMETLMQKLCRLCCFIVCSLPMRNGNKGDDSKWQQEKCVCSLPMRNGNFYIAGR